MAAKSDFFTHQDSFFGRQPEVDYLCRRVAASGATFLAARPKMGKSWLLLAVAQKLAELEPIADAPGYLVGYHECKSGEEFLRYALQDLYTRWLQQASFREQAKQVWNQQKGSWLPAVAAAFGTIFGELGKVGGALSEGVGNAVGKALDGLVSANETLKSGGLELPHLAYDDGRDLTATLATISRRRLVLIFDAWEKSGTLEEEKDFLETYLKHRDEWPQIHFIVAFRNPDLTEKIDDPAWRAAQDLKKSSAATDLCELPALHLEEPAESARLTAYLRGCLPLASSVSDRSLLELLQAYPGTLERWAERSDLATADQLQSEANDAEAYRYRELDGLLSALDKSHLTLALRLALLPRLSEETWTLLQPVVEDGLEADGWIEFCETGLLIGERFPTFGHDTRHRAAATWFFQPAQSGFRPRLIKEASRLIVETGRRVRTGTPTVAELSGILNVVYSTALPAGLTPLAEAVALANTALRGQNPGAGLLFSAKWQGSKENVAELVPILAWGLYNAIIDAETALDLPLAMGLLEELRRLHRSFPDEPTALQQLAMMLVNSIGFVRIQGRPDLTRLLFDELRALNQAYPQNGAVKRELALALRNAIQAAATSNAFDPITPLLEELRALLQANPDLEIVRDQADSLWFGIIYGVRAGLPFEQLRPWLNEMRFLALARTDAMVALLFAQTLHSVGVEAIRQKASARAEAVVAELQTLQLRFPADPALAILLTKLLVVVIAYPPWSEVLPALHPLLAHLQKLCAAFPDEGEIRKPVYDLHLSLAKSCEAAPKEMLPLKLAFLTELRTLAV